MSVILIFTNIDNAIEAAFFELLYCGRLPYICWQRVPESTSIELRRFGVIKAISSFNKYVASQVKNFHLGPVVNSHALLHLQSRLPFQHDPLLYGHFFYFFFRHFYRQSPRDGFEEAQGILFI